MVNIGCWNTWGLNAPKKHLSAKSWIRTQNLAIAGFLETRIAHQNLSNIESNLNPSSWEFLSNCNPLSSCRILLGWDPHQFSLTCINSSDQWITCKACNLVDNTQYILTFVYGLNTPGGRQLLWDYIKQPDLHLNQAWVLMGDFNAILKPDDRVGGDNSWAGHMDDFCNAITHAGLLQPPYTGMKKPHADSPSQASENKSLSQAIPHPSYQQHLRPRDIGS
ncbi:hypothetical protein OIU84_029087 [Salix udensis]|uniref:Endonuclease/exonuclease/phosphatase domain-containing protein n=1 Tax=Salix udensis TaxID=889485 RepID=A0AAD6NPK6_9ROSI|nr:hypothetical protein OIU84_029087 [Salix udensis]